MATTVTVKGQITLPKAVREAAGIRPGDRVIVTGAARGRSDRRAGGGARSVRRLSQAADGDRQAPAARRRPVWQNDIGGNHGAPARRGLTLIDNNVLIDILPASRHSRESGNPVRQRLGVLDSRLRGNDRKAALR